MQSLQSKQLHTFQQWYAFRAYHTALQKVAIICAVAVLLSLTCTGSMCASIRCSVYERQTNRGIEGASVIAISQGEASVTIGPVITGANGDCTLQHVPAGQWQIVAVRIGYTPATALVTVEDEDEELSLSVPIERMPMLYGKVMSESGEPIANASIELRLKGDALDMQCTVRTDNEGSYRIWLGAPVRVTVGEHTITNMPQQHVGSLSLRMQGEALTGRLIQLEVHAQGYKAAVLDVQIPKGQMETEVDIRLAPHSSRIIGTLVNQKSEPIPKATIELRSLSTGESLTSQTDQFGSFQFDGVLAGRYVVRVVGEQVIFQPRLVEVKEGETLTLHLIAISQEQPPLATFLLLREDGVTPIRNARVQITMRMLSPERAYGSSATLITDAQGMCTMPIEKEPAIYRAFLSLSGWSFIVTVDARETRMPKIKIVMPKHPQVVCHVKTHSGETYDAYVHLRMEGELFWENVGMTENGLLRIDGLTPGNYELAATPRNIYAYSDSLHASVFQPVRIRLEDDAPRRGKPIEVVLVMPKCVKLSGKVVMKKGAHEEPLQNATLQLEQIMPGSRLSLATISRQDGTFEFPSVPVGSYRLRASHVTCDDFETTLRVDERAAEQGVTDVLVKLNYTGLGTVLGKLVDCDGNPVKNAKVTLRMWHKTLKLEYEVATTQTKDDGTFTLVNLRPGRYSIELSAEEEGGVTLRNIQVAGDKTENLGTIKLPPPATITGRVVAHDQSIIEDLQLFVCPVGVAEQLEVYLQHSITPPASVVKRAINLGYDGRFSVKLPAGEYELVVYGRPILGMISKRIRANSGENKPVELILPKPASIEGQVKRIDTGEAVSMAIVMVYSSSGRKLAQTVTDTGGFYRIGNVPPGTYSVRCKAEGLAAAVRHHVRLESGDSGIVDFNLSPGASLSGKIAAKGRFVGDFRLYQVIPNADVSLASPVTPDGEFRIEHLSPGRHIIMVYRGGELVAAEEVTLREGEEKSIQITF